MKPTLITVIALALSLNLMAQESISSNPKIYTTNNIISALPPNIDGVLEDSVWDSVEWGGDFIELYPDENTPPSVQTKFKIVYDQKHLYIALKAFDPAPETITDRLSRRDVLVGDRINILIDSYHDLRTAFLFTVTAAGVRGDELITDNGDNIDASWNPIWTTKAVIDSDGWSAELKIPLSQLRFSNDIEQVWGLNISRNYFKNNEISNWDRIPIGSAGRVSEAGELHGINNIKPQKQIEIQPFIVTKLDHYNEEVGNPYRDGKDFTFNAGLDAKIGITNDLTLDVTINPDFGQVEADPAAIALDGFEVFNREQRPFFVENNNIFNFQVTNTRDNLFFSRRIGRSPQLSLNTPEGAFVDRPQNTTILGAVKFSGKTKNGWSVGILESMTSKEYAKVNFNNKTKEMLVEPFTNYFLGRVQKDFNNKNTFFGGIFTATNRSLDSEESVLRKAAYSGGLDFKHQWQERAYFLEANIVMSHVLGSKEAIKSTQENIAHLFGRVGASYLEVDPNRTSLTGTGGRIFSGKIGGKHWNYSTEVSWVSPELELNDIGFLRTTDDISQYSIVKYRIIKPVGIFRDAELQLRQFSSFDFGGYLNSLGSQLNGLFNFTNNWGLNFGINYTPQNYSNSALRGGPRFRFSEGNYQYLFASSDRRKKIHGRLGGVLSNSKYNNTSFFRIDGAINYQPTNAINLSIAPEISNRKSKTQYVTQSVYGAETRYILGTIDNQTLSASLRINYSINPNLSIQYYGQPFISRGHFSNFKFVTNPTAAKLSDRFQSYDLSQIKLINDRYEIDDNKDGVLDYDFQDPNFSVVRFNSNLVARWEYIPGSELFLVWSQGVTSSVSPSSGLFEDLETGILDQRPQNIFLLKLTYRFVM